MSFLPSAIVLATIALSALLYVAVCANVPVVLWTGLNHDDGLYMVHGHSIATGQWLGPYNQFTLMKGAGYPIFLSLISFIRFPAPLAEILCYLLATGALTTLTFKLTRSYILSFLVFEVVLWNFGPVTDRIMRDNIYCSLFILSFCFLVVGLRFAKRTQFAMIALAGLLLGWLWITREEGIVALPGFAIILLHFAILSLRSSFFRLRFALLAATFITTATLPPISIAATNLVNYRSFTNVDVGGDFESALAMLQSIRPNQIRPFLSVPFEVRQKAYAVSPAFARLRPLFEETGSPVQNWKPPGCQYVPTTCGDYASGWFMWAFRDAVALDGHYKDALSASTYYRSVHDQVKHACDTNRLRCQSTFLPFMPQINNSQIRAIPRSFSRLIRMLIFKDPPVIQQTAQIGTTESIRQAAAFLNMETQNRASSSKLISPTASFAIQAKTNIVAIYSKLLRHLIRGGFYAFWVLVGAFLYKRECPLVFVIVAAAWITVGLRLLLLAMIDVSAFPAVYHQYISYAFPLSCFAALLSLYILGDAVLGNFRVRAQSTIGAFV